jgi:hypothetical protein
VASLFRVFTYLDSAPEDEPGGALYIPPQGGGRIDNPGAYSTLYLSDSPAGATAEAFGRFPEWTFSILEGSPALPGSARALARYRLDGEGAGDGAPAICDLDDPARLLALGLRPSDVVSRDYAVTRAWARRIYQQGSWIGVRWWSYYSPAWASIGLWNRENLVLEDVVRLRLNHPALVEAGRTIMRRIIN